MKIKFIIKNSCFLVSTIKDALSLPNEAFKAKFGRDKPGVNDQVIFMCRSGKRSGMAAFEAHKLGFKNVKNYIGSWLEYAEKNNLKLEPDN